MIVQPQSPPQPKLNLRTWLSTEWQHLADLSIQTLALLAVPTLIGFWFNPLLPILAYALQLWAGQSWRWPARWGSVRTWARQGGWFVGPLFLIALLADAHIWFFPSLVALAQTLWRDHLPGELGLLPYPWQYNNLFARLTLLLPLAPILALLYERIDPRTQVDPPRMLRPIDLVKPEASTPPAQPSAPPEPGKDQNAATSTQASTSPSSPAKKRPKTAAQTKQNATPAEEAEQLTIDSFLAPDQGQPAQPTDKSTGTKPAGAAHKKKQGRNQTPAAPTKPITETPPAKQSSPINWDDVAE